MHVDGTDAGRAASLRRHSEAAAAHKRAFLLGADTMEIIAVYITGGLIYGLIELIWRGWTHWSMLLCGGACFALMYRISLSALPFPGKCLASACVITAVEFVTGCLVNIILKWQVWDYSALPGNLMGQICPQFFLLWLLLSIPGLGLCRLLSTALR